VRKSFPKSFQQLQFLFRWDFPVYVKPEGAVSACQFCHVNFAQQDKLAVLALGFLFLLGMAVFG
jgi:hypothetical protein